MHATEEHPVCLQDGYRNQYYIKKGDVHVQIAHQESRHEKNREFTYGDFSSAWINHGYAPQNGTYEYLVWIQPTAQEQKEIHPWIHIRLYRQIITLILYMMLLQA